MAAYDHGDPDRPVDFEAYRQMREAGGLAPVGPGEWAAGRHDSLTEVFRDVDSLIADLSMFGTPEIPSEQLFLSEIPEPRHGRVRRIYNMYLGPHRVPRYGPFTAGLCNQLLDRLLADHPADLVAGYTSPIPAEVIAHVIGVPPADAARFIAWAEEDVMQMRPVDLVTTGRGGELPLHTYVARLVEERRSEGRRADDGPPADVIGGLLLSEVEGAPLSTMEICTQVQFIVGSAVETTRKLLVNMFQMLLERPDVFSRVRGDRALVAPVVEETLRFYSPVQTTFRQCVKDTAVAGIPVKKGERVYAVVGSANRDPSAYDDPDQFRLDRENPRDHLAFGAGPHVCPGGALARLEATTALEVFVDRVAELGPVEGHDYGALPSVGLHRPVSMPVHLTPA